MFKFNAINMVIIERIVREVVDRVSIEVTDEFITVKIRKKHNKVYVTDTK